MKPAWDKLMEEFKDSKTAVVADVDCTVHQDLCGKHGVQGYPTIKYGDPNNMEDYQGGRDFDDLQKFAKENLGPSCGPSNVDLCDAEQKAKIQAFQALSSEELATKIAAEEKKITDAEENFKAEVEKLQANYEKLSKSKDETIANVKKQGLGMMKSVKASKADGKKEL
jgi:protein disulfide-isomerase A6